VTQGRELGAIDPAIEARLGDLRQRCGDIVSSLRRIVTHLRPAVLDGFGLPAAIEWQAGDFARHTGIPVRVDVDQSIELDGSSSSTVFRIFQEALTNVARHAGAGEVRAALRHHRRAIELEVRDDGRGFDQASTGTRSFGLLGMRERALALGGELRIESSPGRGTHILLRLPPPPRLRPAAAAETEATDSAPAQVRKLGAA
jgi:signal transduction histidine kinase